MFCRRLFKTENKLKEHENVCKNHNYCYKKMPKEESIIKYNHVEKSVNFPFAIYADIESLLVKIDTC